MEVDVILPPDLQFNYGLHPRAQLRQRPVKDRLLEQSQPSNQLSITPTFAYQVANSDRLEKEQQRQIHLENLKQLDYWSEFLSPIITSPSTVEAYRYALEPWVDLVKGMRNKPVAKNYKIDYMENNRIQRGAEDQKYGVDSVQTTQNVRTSEVSYYNQKFRQQLVVPGEELMYSVVSTSENFTLLTFPINPGLQSNFPWLSGIAACFEYYMVLDFCIEYRPSCATSTDGSITMAADWDCTDIAPASKKELISMRPSVTGSVWTRLCWTPPRDQFVLHNNGKLLVRQGDYDGDPNLNDLCNFYVGIQGVPDGTSAGDLFVSYTIKFLSYQAIPYPLSTKITGTGTTNPFGTTSVVVDGSSSLIEVSGSAIVFNTTGEFLVTWNISGCTTLTDLAGVGTNQLTVSENTQLVLAAQTAGSTSFLVKILSYDQIEPPTLTLTATGNASVASSTIRIAGYAYALS